MTDVERILINREGYTEDEAAEELQYMRERVYEGEDPEEVLYAHGLEPDYIFDLLEL